MRRIATFLMLVIPLNLISQDLFVQIEQHHGISNFSRQLLPYKLKYSFEYGLSAGIPLTDIIEVKIGAYFQQAGAAAELWFDGVENLGPENSNRQIYNVDFLKIPVDLNLVFGEDIKLSIGIGGYYSFHLKSTFETNSEEGNISAFNPSIVEMSNNDYGIRISPSLLLQLSEKVILQLGILQEFGLYQFITDTRQYSTYLTTGIRYAL